MCDRLFDRIYGEFQAYRASIFNLSRNEMFSKSYESYIITSFYEIIVENIEHFSEEIINGLLESGNILSGLYEEWLKTDDGEYDELRNFVLDEIGTISGM